MGWTEEQHAIYSAIATGDEHVVVEALAGSGKTTTLVEGVKHTRGKTGFVAFNKHIAEELQKRLSGSARACTLHSLGFAAVRNQFRDVQVDGQKADKCLYAIAPGLGKQNGNYVRWKPAGNAIIDLARLTKLTLTSETEDGLREVVAFYGVEIPDGTEDVVFAHTLALLKKEAEETRTIDFDDMIWLPIKHELPVEQFATLMVDESQDLSASQHELVRRATTNGRLIPCGDRRQAIYGFTGSDPDSLQSLIDDLKTKPRGFACRPLNTTFRCPQSHVELARRLVPQIRCRDDAPEGEVQEFSNDPLALAGEVTYGDLVICRTNAPLVHLAFDLIYRRLPARMLGRDIGNSLFALIQLANANDADDLVQKVSAWRDGEVKRLQAKGAAESQIMSVNDRASCVVGIASRCKTLQEVTDFINGIFTNDDQKTTDNTITLASIHKAKGLEANRVFLLESHRLPFCWKGQLAWQQQQEANLLYIAITRSKQSLFFVGGKPEILN